MKEIKELLEANLDKIQTEIKSKFEELGSRIEDNSKLGAEFKAVSEEFETLKEKQAELLAHKEMVAGTVEGKSAGDQLVTEWFGKDEHSKGFVAVENIYNGTPEKKDITIGNDANAGLLVRPQIEQTINTYAQDVYSFINQVERISISSDQLERISNDTATALQTTFWGSELAAGNAKVDLSLAPQIIPAYDIYSHAYITRNMIADAPVVERMVMDEAVKGFNNTMANAAINGDGLGKPAGILGNANVETIQSGAAASLTVAQLISMIGLMKTEYTGGAAMYMNRNTLYDHLLQLVDDETRNYLLPDLRLGVAYSFLGHPVVIEQYLPNMEASSKSVMFANASQCYTVVDRSGLFVQRDPYTVSPKVKFEMHRRMGGDVKIAESAKFMITGTV